MAGGLCGSSVVRALGGPAWLSMTVAILSIIGLGLAFYLARKVRCPSCAQSVFYRFAPTWTKPPPRSGEPNRLRCPHCHEEIDVSGGTLPPSNISLQADREG
jgi:DNA-directed RNA polymerase subunit RPC12/RpoP